MMASHLLKWCHFTQDWGFEPLELHYVRDKEHHEVDFLVTKGKAPWLMIETKLGGTAPGPALGRFAGRLGVPHRFLVVADLKQAGTKGDVHVIDAPTFCASLPV